MTMYADYDKETVHDFLTERRRDFLLGGFTYFRRNDPKFYLNALYRVFAVVVIVFFWLAAVAGVVLSYGNILHVVQCMNVCFVANCGLYLTHMRYSRHFVPLHEVLRKFKKGVFVYDDDILVEEHRKIKKKHVDEIRRVTSLFAKFLYAVVASNLLFVPLLNYFVLVGKKEFIPFMNPYLPTGMPVYFPFDTWSIGGYVAAYSLYVVLLVNAISAFVTNDTVFVSVVLQLKAQFEILDSSIRALEKRARAGVPKKEYLEFPRSLNACFRENIVHYQVLMELKLLCEKYLGLMVFLVVFHGAIALAVNLLLILEYPGFFETVNVAMQFLSEVYYVMHYCWYGELIIRVTNQVNESFYETPWYESDRRFKKLLSIILTETQKPIRIKAIILEMVASMETFGSVISGMYQMMNLLRNT